MTRDEAATIWYGLDAYRQQLETSLAKNNEPQNRGGAGYYEEAMFLHKTLGAIASLMFDIRDNHPVDPTVLNVGDEATNSVRKWLDTE